MYFQKIFFINRCICIHSLCFIVFHFLLFQIFCSQSIFWFCSTYKLNLLNLFSDRGRPMFRFCSTNDLIVLDPHLDFLDRNRVFLTVLDLCSDFLDYRISYFHFLFAIMENHLWAVFKWCEDTFPLCAKIISMSLSKIRFFWCIKNKFFWGYCFEIFRVVCVKNSCNQSIFSKLSFKTECSL